MLGGSGGLRKNEDDQRQIDLSFVRESVFESVCLSGDISKERERERVA